MRVQKIELVCEKIGNATVLESEVVCEHDFQKYWLGTFLQDRLKGRGDQK